MAILDGSSGEQELLRLWGIITELSEQLNEHRVSTASLHSKIGSLKTQAIHSQTGYVLRRFNTDKTDEQYATELERMNVAMTAENRALADDNKQLALLVKEYEQTLESVMATFRKRAHEIQERELALIRNFESQLLVKDSAELAASLQASSTLSASTTRMSRLLRAALRSAQGEDVPPPSVLTSLSAPSSSSSSSSSSSPHPATSTTATNSTSASRSPPDEDEWTASEHDAARAEWALEREIELARLERENEELRRMLGVPHPASSPSPSASDDGHGHPHALGERRLSLPQRGVHPAAEMRLLRTRERSGSGSALGGMSMGMSGAVRGAGAGSPTVPRMTRDFRR